MSDKSLLIPPVMPPVGNCSACGLPYPTREQVRELQWWGGEGLCWVRDAACKESLSRRLSASSVGRCSRCDRVECKGPFPGYSTDMCCPGGPGAVTCAECLAVEDCERNAVNWRTRALAAECDLDATKRKMTRYMAAITDKLHFDLKSILDDTPERATRKELDAAKQMVEHWQGNAEVMRRERDDQKRRTGEVEKERDAAAKALEEAEYRCRQWSENSVSRAMYDESQVENANLRVALEASKTGRLISLDSCAHGHQVPEGCQECVTEHDAAIDVALSSAAVPSVMEELTARRALDEGHAQNCASLKTFLRNRWIYHERCDCGLLKRQDEARRVLERLKTSSSRESG